MKSSLSIKEQLYYYKLKLKKESKYAKIILVIWGITLFLFLNFSLFNPSYIFKVIIISIFIISTIYILYFFIKYIFIIIKYYFIIIKHKK